jgi:hypothetical protein
MAFLALADKPQSTLLVFLETPEKKA